MYKQALTKTCALLALTTIVASPLHATAPEQTQENSAEILNLQSGYYLASKFAQDQHDWDHAEKFTRRLIQSGIMSDELLQRSMILSMGAGKSGEALTIAKHLKNQKPKTPNTLVDLFLILESFKKQDFKAVTREVDGMQNDGPVSFIKPFIESWLAAAQNTLQIKQLNENTAQLYHAILISDFLDDHTGLDKIISTALRVEDIRIEERARIGDLYAHIGQKEKALEIYNSILKHAPNDKTTQEKIAHLKKGANKPLFKKVESPQHGLAKALHDIASILYNEQSDESARIFAHLALYLKPQMSNTIFLLAQINTGYEHYDKAISLYQSIPSSDDDYAQAQYEIAHIYEKQEQYDSALTLLKKQYKKDGNIDTLIRIGDIHRNRQNFEKAVESYNNAAKKIGSPIPAQYWHLHYVRGVAYEQIGNWERAEEELKAALKFQPNHPYILNYLGYAWADQGIYLDASLNMIKKAVALRPTDGYITDSLGWVMYKTHDYKNAVRILERAIELLPYDPTINDHLGDAYWKVGRKLEAKFQWQRAINHSEDEEQMTDIKSKLKSGLKTSQNQQTQ